LFALSVAQRYSSVDVLSGAASRADFSQAYKAPDVSYVAPVVPASYDAPAVPASYERPAAPASYEAPVAPHSASFEVPAAAVPASYQAPVVRRRAKLLPQGKKLDQSVFGGYVSKAAPRATSYEAAPAAYTPVADRSSAGVDASYAAPRRTPSKRSAPGLFARIQQGGARIVKTIRKDFNKGVKRAATFINKHVNLVRQGKKLDRTIFSGVKKARTAKAAPRSDYSPKLSEGAYNPRPATRKY
jgi:hypothetical protein